MEYLGEKYQKLFKKNELRKNLSGFFVYLLIFAATFYFFFYLTNSPILADPDSFYHAKMALLISSQGPIKDFPWFQSTILKNCFTDHHFLYHLFLVPFVKFLPPLWGVKLSVAVFASLLASVFVWFLRNFKIKAYFFYWLVFLTSSPFVFRISLVKANSCSLIFLLLSLYFIFTKKAFSLFILSFFYVWLYGGWPLMLVFVFVYFVATFLEKAIKKNFDKKPDEEIKLDFLKQFIKKESPQAKILAAGLFGLIFGLIINPYFPRNLIFYWYQIVKIGLINYQGIIGVGAEWYPYNAFDLLGNLSLLSILFLIAIILFIIDFSQQNRKTISLFFISLFFLLLTLKSRRYVEYFVPFAILFSAFVVDLSTKTKTLKQFYTTLKKFNFLVKFSFWASLSCIAIMFSFAIYKGLAENKANLAKGASFSKFQKVSRWLNQNTPEASTIFHDNWDSSPYLFYHNSRNYYIIGMDPTFMYLYNPDLYWRWVNITTGKQTGNLKKTIKGIFHSDYVLVDKDHKLLENNLILSNDFKLVYQDEEAKVYEAR